MIVLDASATIEWLMRSSTGVKIDRRLFSPAVTFNVPHLLDVEAAQVLRRYAPLVTCDRKIAQAPGHRAAVEVI